MNYSISYLLLYLLSSMLFQNFLYFTFFFFDSMGVFFGELLTLFHFILSLADSGYMDIPKIGKSEHLLCETVIYG